MRKTVTIDDDLLGKARQMAMEEGATLAEVLDQALRAGLDRSRGFGQRKPYRCKTFSMGYPLSCSLDKALIGADALEDYEILRKLAE